MDYNSYLMGVYGARHPNGRMAGYQEIAREMEICVFLHTNDMALPETRQLTVSGEFMGKPLLNGPEVRHVALSHLLEIWPTYFDGGKNPLPMPHTFPNPYKGA